MGAAHPRAPRQGRQLARRREHLRRRALEQAAAATGKEGVAAEDQGCAVDVRAVVGDVARRVARDLQHLEAQAQGVHLVAFGQAREGLGNAFPSRPVHPRARRLAQGIHPIGVIGVVVGD